jgi:hypothetical protein
MACAEVRSFAKLFTDGFYNGRVIVTQQKRAVTTDVVDILMPIDIPFA